MLSSPETASVALEHSPCQRQSEFPWLNFQFPWNQRGRALWFKLKEEMCFVQISFPIDVVPITKLRPLVLIQIHVLQFLFNLKPNKNQELLKGREMSSPIEPWQPSWNHCNLGTVAYWATEPPCRPAILIWTRVRPRSTWTGWKSLTLCQRACSYNVSISVALRRHNETPDVSYFIN